MEVLAYLIPMALFLGIGGLGAFFWALRTGQFEDMDGAGMRILIDDEDALNEEEHEKEYIKADSPDLSNKQNVDPEREPK